MQHFQDACLAKLCACVLFSFLQQSRNRDSRENCRLNRLLCNWGDTQHLFQIETWGTFRKVSQANFVGLFAERGGSTLYPPWTRLRITWWWSWSWWWHIGKTWTSWVGFKHSHGVWVFSCKFEISIGTCYSCIYHIFLRSFSTLFRFCPPRCQRLSATLSGHWDLWSCCQRATWGDPNKTCGKWMEMDGRSWGNVSEMNVMIRVFVSRKMWWIVWDICDYGSISWSLKCIRRSTDVKKSLFGVDHSMLLMFMNFEVWYQVTSSDCLKNIWCQVSTTCNRTANSKSCSKRMLLSGPKKRTVAWLSSLLEFLQPRD